MAFSTKLVSYTVDADDPFSWESSFNIGMTSSTVNVTINVRLIGAEPGGPLRNIWETGFETHWNNKAFFSDGESLYRINFNFNFVSSGEHHVVTVHAGNGRANMTNWYTDLQVGQSLDLHDETAAHEGGHMFGLPDEYPGGGTMNNFTTTGTLMSDLTVMDSTTTAGYQNYFWTLEHYVEQFGFDSTDGVDLVLADLGTAGNDNLIGGSGLDAMFGFNGNDRLRGRAGNDRLEGGNGNDLLDGGDGYNRLNGGSGSDTVDYRFYDGDIVVDLADGTAFFTPDPRPDILISIENVLAGDGSDELYGNSAANTLNGGGGRDWLQGFSGNDTYYVDSYYDDAIEASGRGIDTVIASVTYELNTGSSIERLRTSDPGGTRVISLYGNASSQTLDGNNGANRLDGGGGSDTLIGRGGNDSYYVDRSSDNVIEFFGQGTSDRVLTTSSYSLGAGDAVETIQVLSRTTTNAINLNGNEFINSVFGNNGANILNGMGGSDKIRTYGGNDIVRFNTAIGVDIDTIYDFDRARDIIQIDDAIFTVFAGPPTPRGLSVFNFSNTGAAVDGNDFIIYNPSNGFIGYDPDADGLGGIIFFARAVGNPALSASDFQII